ncbi:scarecrow-like protein 1 [Salvia miltiorrhiza]|uniref:scarecrow-like protein 1 n=1 Tax=Salvia miltiorrhiza TaxID=226208 RepID=UPI0025AD4768|nr:scarecrow-like protein 1 [Salvia miltiorrhiza]XP_057795588.1 scarecrow-like protein 1 [Salvia miltiorrhiza]XP_057795589.1 scarecrow-like protein 1 [Salvia miltiorrhiza]XP_057795590.1 scarecrow-like protein 1 [Salvia miltiorrhiza]XP_057795591.1 scarecrow-like protein 1 [Salvia miltiorrhiza]XP_057795592.1 scarecrow-like protein 1 [Salvia miltiorrhiza]
MPLVTSAANLGSHERYTLKDGDNTSETSISMFGSDATCTSQSSSGDSYGQKYLLDSPLVTSRQDIGEFDYELDGQSLDMAGYDSDKMKLKLQELEKVLLDDNAANDDCQNMEIEGGLSDTTCYALIHDSPKESSSSNSIRSIISSTRELSFTTTLTPKSLLFECAAAIQNGNCHEASQMIDVLRQRVSIQGEPSDRIAAYMVEALVARMATSGRGLYKALKCKSPPSSDRLSAMQVLFEACPCFRFGFMAANGAILETCRDEERVHIIDFDINQGSQYYTLLKTLAETRGQRPHVRLTGVDDPESVQRGVGGLNIIGERLEQLAKDLQLSFEFHAVAAETALVSPSLLGCRQGEALVVNFAFQLHHLPDESVSTANLRDQLLRMVKSLKPKLVTLVEQDVNTNTSPFLLRFAEAYNYYSAVFASLDATLGRNNQDRINVEKHCLARDIINVVACEGEERIERYEVAGKWKARMSMAGFNPRPISGNVYVEIQKLIRQYSDRYKVKEETGSLHFGWEDKMLILSSAWR